jgi:hypothetical protein
MVYIVKIVVRMLFNVTIIVDLLATATTLWGAFYHSVWGFSRWITLHAVIILLLLSIFFIRWKGPLFCGPDC